MATFKLSPYLWKRTTEKGDLYGHWCQGCNCLHYYDVPRWTFNNNVERPSFTPSMRIFTPAGPYGDNDEMVPERTICHFFVTDGQIAYCGDCAHQYAGQTLPLAPIPDNYGF